MHAGARFIGLVLFQKSPRFLVPERALALAAKAKGRVESVALLVDPDDEALHAAALLNADWLQLHGHESQSRIAQARQFARRGVIKALPIAGPDDVRQAHGYASAADMLLFDAKAPPGAAHPGGNGVAFDWRLLAGQRFVVPWMLSGGLTPENVALAMQLSGAVLVDASSGLESAPGIKDHQRIAAFVRAAHTPRLSET